MRPIQRRILRGVEGLLLFAVFALWDDGATSLFAAAIAPLHCLALASIGAYCGEDLRAAGPLIRPAALLPALLAASL